MTGTVYVVIAVPYVKIGFTNNMPRRMAELRRRDPGCRYPDDLSPDEPVAMVKTFPASIAMERLLHCALEESRAVGDWYHLDERMMRWINHVYAGFLSPGVQNSLRSGSTPTTWWRSTEWLKQTG